MRGIFWSGENASAPAAPSPLAKPTQAPAIAPNSNRWRSDSCSAPAIASALIMIAVSPAMDPIKSIIATSMRVYLHVYS